MIKAKQVFFWTSNLKGHGFHGDKATILYLVSKYYWLSVLSVKLYFLEIGSVHQKLLWSFKCVMLKMLNSTFFDWQDTLMVGTTSSLLVEGAISSFHPIFWLRNNCEVRYINQILFLETT